MRKNLRYAFPDQTQEGLEALEKAFYRHFCDLLVEYIKSLTMPATQVLDKCVVRNAALLDKLYAEGKDILLLAGHYGNWEWAANAIALQSNYKVGVIYKSLSNPYFDRLVQRLRQRFDKFIIHEKAILRTMSRYHVTPQAIAFLADQAPLPAYACTMNFLNIPTYVTSGLEKIATKFNQVVVYVHIQKTKRGYYSLDLEVLMEHPTSLPPSRLTMMYLESLEKDIYLDPSLWLWTHNRWKDRIT